MRLWEGKEKEGAQMGVKTLFVESKRINRADLLIIQSVVKKRNIKRIYFGAGKINPQYINKEWYKILNNCEVVVETSCASIQNLSHADKFKSIVLRNDISLNNYANVVPKIDNGKSVTLYYGAITNSLATLKNGIYTNNDTLLQI